MKSGNREVLLSGCVVTHGGDETVELSYEDLTFRLFFEERGEAPAVKTEPDPSDPKGMIIRLADLDDPLGGGWFSEVGTSRERTLFLSIYMFALGKEKKMRQIAFTFSIGES